MTKRDRSVLGGLVLAMIVGVGGSLALAASCLGRDRAHRTDDAITAFPEDRSARTSGGGVPGEEAVGTTQITGADLPPGGLPGTAPANAPPPNPSPAPIASPAPQPVPASTVSTTVNVSVGSADAAVSTTTTTTTMSADAAGAAPPATTATTPTTNAGADGGTATGARDAGATASAAPAGTGRFVTDAPPFGASSWTANPEAGAGPFTTERNAPERSGP